MKSPIDRYENDIFGCTSFQGRHLRGPRKKKKKEKRKKKKKEKKKIERKKGTMNNVELLHIKCCFFQFFNKSGSTEKFKKILASPQEKVEMTPLLVS